MIYKRQILLYLLEFMRITGLRSQEAKALRKEDFKKEVVTFRDEVSGEMITTKCIIVLINKSVGSTYTEELTIKEPKTMNAVRGVPVLREDDRNFINEILRFTRNDYVFSDYYGNLISSKDVADYIGRVRKSYNKAKGRDLDIYAYLMRKSLGSDTEKSGTAAARKKLMGHKSEYTAGRWYSSASEDDVLSSMWNRKYKHKKEKIAVSSVQRVVSCAGRDQNTTNEKLKGPENGLFKPNGVNLKRLAFLFSQRYQETEVETK